MALLRTMHRMDRKVRGFKRVGVFGYSSPIKNQPQR